MTSRLGSGLPHVKLKHPFYRLPFQFDAERLATELEGVDEAEWIPHPQGLDGARQGATLGAWCRVA